MRRAVAALLFATACGVRAPAPVDVAQLVQTRGSVEARRNLQSRVLAHPRDIAARLALAKLADGQGRPSEAFEQLETVEHLGGPLGVRWHDDDRARFGRLVLARGRARLARNSPEALADLEHAQKLGAAPTSDELESARLAIAFEQLRHVDAAVRTQGRAALATRSRPEWRGAQPKASLDDRARFGVWLWTIGARREAYEQLTHGTRDEGAARRSASRSLPACARVVVADLAR